MKNTSILLLIGAVIVIGAIGYAVTQKTPLSDMPDSGDPAAMMAEGAEEGDLSDDMIDTTEETPSGDATMDEGASADDGAVSTTMPVPGIDTTEMVVADDVVTIAVSGMNFSFDKEVIRVKEGQTVTIVFTSEDGFHDWVVDAFSARTAQVMTGNSSEVTFVADKKGTFEYYCSVGAHRANGMVGQLIVE